MNSPKADPIRLSQSEYNKFMMKDEQEADKVEKINVDTQEEVEVYEQTDNEDDDYQDNYIDMRRKLHPQATIEEDGPWRHMEGKGLAKFFKKHKQKIVTKCKDGNLIDKLFFPFEYIVEFLMTLTIPPGDKDEYNCSLAALYPFTSIWLVVLVFTH